MSKNKLIALGLSFVLFIGLFYTAFLDINPNNPKMNVLAFSIFVTGILIAIFIGNNEKMEDSSDH